MEQLVQGAAKLGVEITVRQQEQFQVYYEELMAWNKRINLTRITNYVDVQLKHFLDSLSPSVLFQSGSRIYKSRAIDIGSGAGFPGLPLKIVFPSLDMVLLESTGKKAHFLIHLKDVLSLDGIQVITGRAEDLGHSTEYREGFQLVLSRGLSQLAALAELMLPFCAPDCIAVAMKKGDISREIKSASYAIEVLGGRLREVREIDFEEFDDDRKLVVIEKNGHTPKQYPRRAGIPAKRPIQN